MESFDVPLDLVALLMVVFGVVLLVVGVRVVRVVFGLLGFAVGAVAARWAVPALFAVGEVPVAMWAGVGAVTAVVAVAWSTFGSLVLGVVASALLAFAILVGRGMPEVAWWALAIAAGFGGVIAVLVPRVAQTMATAALGAWGLLRGGEYFLFGRGAVEGGAGALVLPDADLTYAFVLLLVALSVGGAFLQLVLFGGGPSDARGSAGVRSSREGGRCGASDGADANRQRVP